MGGPSRLTKASRRRDTAAVKRMAKSGCALLAVLAWCAAITAQAPPPGTVFAEAKSALTLIAVQTRPEYLAYIAHREHEAGSAMASGDFQAAFEAARALPGPAALKDRVEFDVVDSLLLAREDARAVQLAPQADAAREAIYDRLIPAEIGLGHTAEAWGLWTGYDARRSGFPFRAAAALSCGPEAGSPRAGNLRARGAAAAAQVRDIGAAERAMDFLEACTVADRQLAASGAVSLWRAMAMAPGENWEVAELRDRVRYLVRRVAPSDSASLTLPPQPRPALKPSPASPSPSPPRQSTAGKASVLASLSAPVGGDYIYFELGAAMDMAWDRCPMTPGSAPNRLEAHLEFADYSPVSVARLAVACFEAKQVATASGLAARALNAAAVRAGAMATRPAGEGFARDSDILDVFRLVAQIEPEAALAKARTIVSVVRPLALADVARALAAPTTPPGKRIHVLN